MSSDAIGMLVLGASVVALLVGFVFGWIECEKEQSETFHRQESVEVAALRRSLMLTQAAWETERAMWQTAQQQAQGRW